MTSILLGRRWDISISMSQYERLSLQEKKERYLLDYLGSVSCAQKGVEIIVQVKEK